MEAVSHKIPSLTAEHMEGDSPFFLHFRFATNLGYTSSTFP